MSDIEILEFLLPTGNRKNLFVTGIPQISEDEIIETIYSKFSSYGPIYGTNLYPYGGKVADSETDGATSSPASGYYAFVTFYLASSARRAKEEAMGKIIIGNSECKIAYAKKKKDAPEEPQALHFQKCQELANIFLGFNGWSTSVKYTDEEYSQSDTDTFSFRSICISKLELPHHGLHTEGVGMWIEVFDTKDPASRGKAVCKAKKLAYQRSIENAFSKILLVVLSNGKVHVEVDTTRPELQLTNKHKDEENLLQVNELNEDPADMSSSEDHEDSIFTGEDTDEVNLRILKELENE